MFTVNSYRLDVFEGGSSSTGARFIDRKALLEVFDPPGNESISDRRRFGKSKIIDSKVPFKVWGMDSFSGINNGESLRDLGFKSPIELTMHAVDGSEIPRPTTSPPGIHENPS